MAYEDIESSRAFERLPIGGTNLSIEVMIYGAPLGAKPPLFILNSHEFAMPPSEAFCELAWEAGYQTLFLRRTGCAQALSLPRQILQTETVRNGAATVTEAATLARFIDEYAEPGAVVVSLGGSNPVAYRLYHFCPTISLFVFVNPVFNQSVWASFSPVWFRRILEQTLTSRPALHMSSAGLKHLMGRDPYAFYHQVLEQSAGDIDYLDTNRADFMAAGELAKSASPEQLFYVLNSNFRDDPLLTDGAFEYTHTLAVTGSEAPDPWRAGMRSECARLGVPLTFLPSGFIFAPYQSPDAFFDTLRTRLETAPPRSASRRALL